MAFSIGQLGGRNFAGSRLGATLKPTPNMLSVFEVFNVISEILAVHFPGHDAYVYSTHCARGHIGAFIKRNGMKGRLNTHGLQTLAQQNIDKETEKHVA